MVCLLLFIYKFILKIKNKKKLNITWSWKFNYICLKNSCNQLYYHKKTKRNPTSISLPFLPVPQIIHLQIVFLRFIVLHLTNFHLIRSSLSLADRNLSIKPRSQVCEFPKHSVSNHSILIMLFHALLPLKIRLCTYCVEFYVF